MVIREKTRSTFADYRALPETNQIVELIDGEIVVNPPYFRHQRALLKIIYTLEFADGLGTLCVSPTGLHVDDHNSFEPDLFWVRADSSDCVLEPDGRYWRGAPDLVIEILSPSTGVTDRGVKFEAYQRIGVREYWLVDTVERFVEVYRGQEGLFQRQGLYTAEQSFTSAALDGAEIAVKTWFSE